MCKVSSVPCVAGRYASRKAAQILHGGGTFSNSGNRWFDKTLQVRTGDESSMRGLWMR